MYISVERKVEFDCYEKEKKKIDHTCNLIGVS